MMSNESDWVDLPTADDSDWVDVSENKEQDYDWSNAPRDLLQTNIDALPMYGAALGGALGLGIASVPFAGAGAAAGESLKNGINSLWHGEQAKDVPKTPVDILNRSVESFNQGAVSEMGGQIISRAGSLAAPRISEAYQGLKKKIGNTANDAAESLAFKSGGAMLKDFRTADAKGTKSRLGRYILDNGLKIGDSVDDIAARTLQQKAVAGEKLDDIYNRAASLFKESSVKPGFDPIRDKAEVMRAAADELGDTVGANEALNKLSKYLDEVAARHGDAPMNEALKKYESEMADYAMKEANFLKDKAAYQSQVGSAGDDLDQGLLPVFADDFQRTSSASRPFEVHGTDASKMTAEPYEQWTQQSLLELPTRPQKGFNQARGDDLLPLQQQMYLDDVSNRAISDGYQSEILGTQATPRVFRNAEITTVSQGRGQMQFPEAPAKPTLPTKPLDIRNPMAPRATNDIKSSLDDAINYSRNPLSKEPATEVAYSSARNSIMKKVDESIEALGGSDLAQALKEANREYGSASEVSRMALDKGRRESANRMFGLTDTITGGAALSYGAATDDWKTAVGVMVAKKGLDKYGTTALAKIADSVGKSLLKNPQLQKIAVEQPKVFGAMVYKLMDTMEQKGAPILKAAEAPDNSAQTKPLINKDEIIQKTSGSKYQQVLQNAAQKGDASFNAAHYVLSTRDPQYRKQVGN